MTDSSIGTLPVAVVIPAYNRAQLLADTLKSVAAQEHPPAETIVVDDGSTDDSAAVGQAAGARVIRHDVNRGLAAARNTGIEQASSEWVALLDSDDRWLSHHLATLWPLRDGHQFVAGSALRVTDDLGYARFQGTVRRHPQTLRSPSQLIFPGNFICVSAVLVRRASVLASGGFRAYDGVVEDLEMWLRLLRVGTALVTPEVTMLYRVHPGQMSEDHSTMHRAHVAVSRLHMDNSKSARFRMGLWRGTSGWDQLRLALENRRWRDTGRWAFRLLVHPVWALGVAGTLIRRCLVRRRSLAAQKQLRHHRHDVVGV